jgi:hypothetical protein
MIELAAAQSRRQVPDPAVHPIDYVRLFELIQAAGAAPGTPAFIPHSKSEAGNRFFGFARRALVFGEITHSLEGASVNPP